MMPVARCMRRVGAAIPIADAWSFQQLFCSEMRTSKYVEADLAMKQKALAKLQDTNTTPRRFRAADSLLEFLKKL